MTEPQISIDAIGLLCPLPVLKLRKALLRADPGTVVQLIATDPAAAIDVPHFCAQSGDELISRAPGPEAGSTVFCIQKT